MVEKSTKDYAKVLNSIKSDLEDFNDRYDAGNSILLEEWENMAYDWHFQMCVELRSLITEIDKLNFEQRKMLEELLSSIQTMKNKVIEKKYTYLEIFDTILAA